MLDFCDVFSSDNVRAPIPQKQEVLVPDEPSYGEYYGINQKVKIITTVTENKTMNLADLKRHWTSIISTFLILFYRGF